MCVPVYTSVGSRAMASVQRSEDNLQESFSPPHGSQRSNSGSQACGSCLLPAEPSQGLLLPGSHCGSPFAYLTLVHISVLVIAVFILYFNLALCSWGGITTCSHIYSNNRYPLASPGGIV